MKRVLSVFSACLVILFGLEVLAQQSGQGANQTAKSEKSNDFMMGAASGALGGMAMKSSFPKACPKPGTPPACDPWDTFMFYVAGPGMIAMGIADAAKGSGRSSSINPTEMGFNMPGEGSGAGGLGSGSVDGVSPQFGSDLQNAIDAAKAMGIDPTSQAGLDAAKAAGTAALGGMDPSKAADSATPEQLAKLDELTKQVAAKFNVPNLLNFSGGGGGSHRHGGKDDLDLNALFDKMKDKDRGPASIDGLQKNFNGDQIGVAGDDIFKIITRRYQSKIKDKTFLETASTGPGAAPLKKK